MWPRYDSLPPAPPNLANIPDMDAGGEALTSAPLLAAGQEGALRGAGEGGPCSSLKVVRVRGAPALTQGGAGKTAMAVQTVGPFTNRDLLSALAVCHAPWWFAMHPGWWCRSAGEKVVDAG